MDRTVRIRTRLLILAVIAGVLAVGCVGLAVGFTIGNIIGENAVCDEVWDHSANPEDIPTCRDPWW